MSRVLLLLPTASYRAADFLDAARRLGVEVVVGADEAPALAEAGGDRSVVVPIDDPVGTADAAVALDARAPLDAVVAVDDGGVVGAALASERLGLPHNPPDAVRATRDKAAMRALLAAAEVPQPAFRVAGPGDDVAALAAALGGPVVVKPLTLSASRGVIRADDPAVAAAVATRVRGILADAGEDPDGRLLVERFVPGVEVALEGLLRGGRLDVLALFDKPDPLDGPYFEETIYVTPSRLAPEVQAGVADVVARAAAAMGLREGPIHAEVRVDPGAGAPASAPEVGGRAAGGGMVTVLEVAARTIGGLCGRTLRFGAGISLEEIVLRHALGRPLDGRRLRRQPGASGVVMLPIPSSGRLVAVRGRQQAAAVPGVVGLEITIPEGRPVRALPDGDRYLGFAFARGERPEDVEHSLRQVVACLDVHIEPEAGPPAAH